MSSHTIAALDLGSNTFRLMLAGVNGGDWAGKRVFQHIPRLSESLTDGGRFAPAALTRAWAALEDFHLKIEEAGAVRVLAGATMAARLAADGPDFMDGIKSRFGWETEILPGEEEARLTATGVLTGLEPMPEEALIFDIGGRSTEFISAARGRIRKSRSLAIGVVRLTEAFLNDPIRSGELEAVAAEVRRVLGGADFSDVPAAPVLVGTAGTVTTVAALLLKLKEYQPELVNNARLERSAIEALLHGLASETIAARVEKYGLHPRRADAIVAGLVLVLEIMDFFGQPWLLVSDNGLLEGIWLKAAGLL
ncbi:exopolyphosphatase [Deltaproteobacteria bacterium Smac51]|nr:exopolyphosphatase [Deltaproteobacteria bacterium Smac51]